MRPRLSRIALRLLLAALLLLAAGVGWIVYRLNDHPSLEPYASYLLKASEPTAPGASVSLTFLGVSTILISDGETALLTDGFFTRPSLAKVALGKVEPDRETIVEALESADIDTLEAVIVVHSHYDHSMDAPEVARRTGALLVGSESTANVGRGWGLPEERLRVPASGEPIRFGDFTVTLIQSKHFPHGQAMGEITEPLVPPARAMAYQEGGSWSVHVGHPLGNLLIHSSAGWIPGALDGYQAHVALLGIGLLGTRDEAYRQEYLREVVEAVGAQWVVPIHYDDFTRPLDQPLLPLPAFFDDIDASMRFLVQQAETRPDLDLALLPFGQPVVVFATK